MDMPSDRYKLHLAELVRIGAVSQNILDDAVRRVLLVKFELGLFDNPYTDTAREKSVLLAAENVDAARKIAQRSIVLLRNEGDVLPLTSKAHTIAIVGPLADSKADMLGNWIGKGQTAEAVSVLDGVRARAGAGVNVVYAKGSGIQANLAEETAAAVETVKKADIAIA